MTAPAQTSATPRDPARRLARRLMPFIKADSALLPTDRWIVSTLKEACTTVAPVRRDLGRAGRVAALALGGVALAVAGVAVLAAGVASALGGAAVLSLSAIALAQAASTGAAVFRSVKTESLPALADAMAARYATYKVEEMSRVWKERMAARQAAKAAAPAASDAAPAPQASPESLAGKALRGVFGRKRSSGAPVPPPTQDGKPPQP